MVSREIHAAPMDAPMGHETHTLVRLRETSYQCKRPAIWGRRDERQPPWRAALDGKWHPDHGTWAARPSACADLSSRITIAARQLIRKPTPNSKDADLMWTTFAVMG